MQRWSSESGYCREQHLVRFTPGEEILRLKLPYLRGCDATSGHKNGSLGITVAIHLLRVKRKMVHERSCVTRLGMANQPLSHVL